MSGKASRRKFHREREQEGRRRKRQEAEQQKARLKGFDPDVTHGDLIRETSKHRLADGLRFKK